MQLLVHGGAGTEPDEPEPRREVLDEAAAAGARERSVVDAVERAVRVLEDSPRFNAGVGSAVQSDGAIRTDAGIMTHRRDVGAVCSVPGVAHAVSAARVVMEETPHVLLSGERAAELAGAYGVETGVDCWSERTRKRWDDLEAPEGGPREQLAWLEERFGESDPGGRDREGESTDDGTDHDTVGAVARAGDRLAAATSTGGRWLALAGRVGDVPQVGSGYYCCPEAAVSATGAGEDIARTTLSRRVADHIGDGRNARKACEAAIEEFEELTGSTAGVIAADGDGGLGSAFNSSAMQTARAER
ncbi:isoaspartyl peptidase/L-asparaginase [Saliphagus sp. LR7]|uniref:isoaspartyl peptidase/L-asparaginase n=1 Tax=Saliphagus sp. LR7 TaxID=2282654 RepID=UPI000DF776D1|nr:isoaspartyl peptidase/L-asparaginase family protein [Saliphagus sp. LR7]